MKKQQDMVKEFHKVFNHPYSDKPGLISCTRMNNRIKWIQEEVDELSAANTLVDTVDALGDIMYFVLGTFVELGINSEKIFNIIHKSNMSKVPLDGVLLFKEDGKVAKPDTFITPEPEILKEINNEYNSIGN